MSFPPANPVAFLQSVSHVAELSGNLSAEQWAQQRNPFRSAHCSSRKRQRVGQVLMTWHVSRRQFAQTVFSAASLGAMFAAPGAVEAILSPFAAPENLISRIAQKTPPRPEAKLFEEDLFYPDYFAGVWDTESKLISVTCPAGYKLFGRPGSFESARRDINKTLKYPSRFIRSGKRIVSDRVFDVQAIAEASMGPQSVLNCTLAGNSPNRLTTTIRPNGADGEVFLVTMKALARQQQEGPLPGVIGDADVRPAFMAEPAETESSTIANVDGKGLYTSEMVVQEVRRETEDLRVMPLIKEIETTTLFITKPMDENCIEAWQKTSSYLTRSSLQYVDAHGHPVDVRWYKLKYYRKVNRP